MMLMVELNIEKNKKFSVAYKYSCMYSVESNSSATIECCNERTK
jgi:hypothetical protein